MEKIKIEKEYLQEAISIKNLYNGANIMGNYTSFKFIEKSLKISLEYNELKVLSISKTMKLIDEIKECCKTDLEQMCDAVRKSEIYNFSFSDKKTISILPDFSDIINKKLPNRLDKISEEIESYLYTLLTDIITAKIYIEKFSHLEDEEYIENNDEIASFMIQIHNYNLNYDRLEKLSNIQTEYDADKLMKDIVEKKCRVDVDENMGGCLSSNISYNSWISLVFIKEFFDMYTNKIQK